MRRYCSRVMQSKMYRKEKQRDTRWGNCGTNPSVRRLIRQIRPQADLSPYSSAIQHHSPVAYQTVLCGTESRSPPVHPADEAAGRNLQGDGMGVPQRTLRGEREGAHPRVKSAAAACTVRGRNRVSDFFLAAFPLGSPNGATGNAVRGVPKGGRQSPFRSPFTE